jgi:deoxyinosine 3'endonuclease (endonuclease V)
MIACLDVSYSVDHAIAAGIVFNECLTAESMTETANRCETTTPYILGRLFELESPFRFALFVQMPLKPAIIVIDGYV